MYAAFITPNLVKLSILVLRVSQRLFGYGLWNSTSCAPEKKEEVNFTLEQDINAQRRSRVQPYSLINLGARCVWWATPHLDHFTPDKETRYPLHKRLGGSRYRHGRVRQISSPRRSYPQTVHPVTSSCTGWDIPASRMVKGQQHFGWICCLLLLSLNEATVGTS